jgi:hypothetical protein
MVQQAFKLIQLLVIFHQFNLKVKVKLKHFLLQFHSVLLMA